MKPEPAMRVTQRPVPPPASPLLPVMVALMIAAVVSGWWLARWFPQKPEAERVNRVRFVDATQVAGLPQDLRVSDLAVADWNGDGEEDIMVCAQAEEGRGGVRLFLAQKEGRFAEANIGSGLASVYGATALAAGDYDGDGRMDLFLAGIGLASLWRNEGEGVWRETTAEAGFSAVESQWPRTATWLDLDQDGDLDLVVSQYGRWPLGMTLADALRVEAGGRSYGTPLGLAGVLPTVYRNEGGGRFSPASRGAGLVRIDPTSGGLMKRMLALVPVEANGDGWMDLLMCNEGANPVLFHNRGNGEFRSISEGVEEAVGGGGQSYGAAGVMAARIHSLDAERVARWRERATHPHAVDAFGMAPPRPILEDFDGDGRLEFLAFDPIEGDGFVEARKERREGEAELLAWPVAALDFDRDGARDALVVSPEGALRLLRNVPRRPVSWISIRLPKSARTARIEIHTPRQVIVQTLAPAGGSMAAYFGLEEDVRVRKGIVTWPDGRRQEFVPEGINREIAVAAPN